MNSKANLVHYYPILLFILGIVIHIRDVVWIVLGYQDPSVWVWWVHSSMLVFNTLMLIGLILRRRFAYLFSACGLVGLILFQVYDEKTRVQSDVSSDGYRLKLEYLCMKSTE